MRIRSSLIIVTLTLTLGGFVEALPKAPPPVEPATNPEGRWMASVYDNICGITDLRKVSNPARVNYPFLLAATPQMQEIKRERIDPNSVEGKALRNRAKTLITRTSELVRQAKGHCGIWKVIRNEDGRIVPDMTSSVKKKL